MCLGLSVPVECVIIFLLFQVINLWQTDKHFQPWYMDPTTNKKHFVNESTKTWQQNNWFPVNPLRFRWLLPVHVAVGGGGGRHGGRQTERQRMLTHSRPSGLMGKKNSRRGSLQNVSSCFRSRHGNSSSLQSGAYLRAIRAKTRQQLRPLLFPRQLLKEGLFGSTCDFFCHRRKSKSVLYIQGWTKQQKRLTI